MIGQPPPGMPSALLSVKMYATHDPLIEDGQVWGLCKQCIFVIVTKMSIEQDNATYNTMSKTNQEINVWY